MLAESSCSVNSVGLSFTNRRSIDRAMQVNVVPRKDCSLATTKFFSGKITSKARKDKAQVVSAERIQIMQVWCIYSEVSIIIWFLQYLAITLITWLEFFFVTILSLLMSFLLFNVRWHGPIYFWWMALN